MMSVRKSNQIINLSNYIIKNCGIIIGNSNTIILKSICMFVKISGPGLWQ